jgi:hypothetical protein
MLGGMDKDRDTIPYPNLPRATKSMEPDVFVLAALASLGTDFTPESEGVYVNERDGKVDRICFDEALSSNAILYRPGTPAFSRLTTRIAANAFHRVQDMDEKPGVRAEAMTREWVDSFGGNFLTAQVQGVQRSFAGTAVVRVRATVGHDSYERLVDVVIPPGDIGPQRVSLERVPSSTRSRTRRPLASIQSSSYRRRYKTRASPNSVVSTWTAGSRSSKRQERTRARERRLKTTLPRSSKRFWLG